MDDLASEMATLADDPPFGFRGEASDDHTRGRLILVEKRRVPPKIGLILGDCVNNYRAALDHLVFQLPRAPGTPAAWMHNSQFPIQNNAGAFANRAPVLLQGVAPAAIAVIEALQPYAAGTPPEGHPLWSLRELTNRDKHRLAHFAALVPTYTGLYVEPPPVGHVLHGVMTNGGFDDGAVVGCAYYSEPVPPGGMTLTPTVNFGITIAEFEPAIGVLTCTEGIDGAVVDAISKLAPFL